MQTVVQLVVITPEPQPILGAPSAPFQGHLDERHPRAGSFRDVCIADERIRPSAGCCLSMGYLRVMANRPRSTTEDWVEVGYELLGEGGPEAVRIEEIARRLGVARSGFYHRFGSKRALWDAINERWMADGFDAYLRAGALGSPLERLRGIGYFGLGNERLRRADYWLLARGPQTMALGEHVENVRGRAVSWVAPHLVELGFEPPEAERRAYVYYLAYLGLAADLDAWPAPVDVKQLRQVVDAVVDVVVAPSPVRGSV